MITGRTISTLVHGSSIFARFGELKLSSSGGSIQTYAKILDPWVFCNCIIIFDKKNEEWWRQRVTLNFVKDSSIPNYT